MFTSKAPGPLKGFAEIHGDEVTEIRNQRANRLGADQLPEKEVEDNLVGLAISGGGIRSGTFALGVLQELRRQDLLRIVDYLSTVSGGGYIGSWFASNRLRRGMEEKEDSRNADFLTDEHDAVRHLRRYGRYLTPKTGFLSSDTWTAIAIWLRNTLSIQFLLLLFLTLVMLLPHAALPWFEWVAKSNLEQTFKGFQLAFQCIAGAGVISIVCLMWQRRPDIVGFKLEVAQTALTLLSAYLMAPLIWSEVSRVLSTDMTDWHDVIAVAFFLGFMTLVSRALCLDYSKVRALKRGQLVGWLLWFLCSLLIQMVVIVAVGLVCGITLFKIMGSLEGRELVQVIQKGVGDGTNLTLLASGPGFGAITTQIELMREAANASAVGALKWAVILGGPMVVLTYAVLIGTGVSMSGSDVHDRYREWWARLGAWLFILSLGTFALELVVLKGPEFVAWLLPEVKGRIGALGTWLVGSGIGVKLAGSEETNGTKDGSPLKEKLLSLAPLIFFTGLMLTVACLTQWLVTKTTELWPEASKFPSWVPDFLVNCPLLGLGLALALLLLILVAHFDINELSMNQFYRNRLMRCYLGATRRQADRKPATFTGFDFADDVKLTDYRHQPGVCYPGPFWIVNTALNTSKNPDLDVAERQAESFAFTALNSGFERGGMGVGDGGKPTPQGYRLTAEYMGGAMGAAAAVSISGAAASPNSGYHTSPLIAFMLTVFNARLGWWSANPAVEKAWQQERPPFYKGMSWYVLKELFGGASVGDPFVYLSDGGHFENLGLYELVRRRCQLIIVSDGEEDGGYTFHALGTAIRRCWVDFGVRIVLDTSSITPEIPGGACRGHCAIGRVEYPDGKVSTLIYLKSSWTGDEPTDLQQYRAANPAFPHESTGDQFFTESQFESYRKLGAHVTRTCLAPTMTYLKKCKAHFYDQDGQPRNVAVMIRELATALEHYWVPLTEGGAADFIQNTETLVGIWRDVQRDPTLTWMLPIVLPSADTDFSQSNLPARDAPWPGHEPEIKSGRIICQRLFQVMENVYIALDLARTTECEDNSGWMNLFRHWARFDFVRGEWAIAKGTFGSRFGAFWEQRLEPDPAAPPPPPPKPPLPVPRHPGPPPTPVVTHHV
ncbi:MAG: patatin-like phospholipase family protein [Verrucomicrobiota bacterium]